MLLKNNGALICPYRKPDDANGEAASSDKRVWEQEEDQAELNAKRTRMELGNETGSGR